MEGCLDFNYKEHRGSQEQNSVLGKEK